MIYLKTMVTSLSMVFALNLHAEAGKIPTVDSADLPAYLGLWHEVRRIENDFQDKESKKSPGVCFNTTAEYSLLPNDKIEVKNTCFRNDNSGEVAVAKARVVEGSNNAKLKVNFTGNPVLEFLGIGDGDYWILALGPLNAQNLYSWVLVGSPDLNVGWILSRTPSLETSDLDTALDIADSLGYKRDQFKSFQR